ncbi:(2R)-ethylmalonyl-CoA mutase [Kineosphaera limosa]|uniref:Coenzyme B12-dependent mutase n=1 Tax=Kineosphaera limosa NBRC 100340 TaxID=1184609 RepID=K6WPC1_9MICO|nr:protein meaA [Kineosphaera limosa]NYD99572.1 (2R)-ethylmalonyl-CoA mutase [Kineosphaera limosa]GAB95671.1 coenzyme B12-dependent mutase [Kineosphaera limosa NBRC 100340]
MGERTKPWVMRTYAGHSSAAASNELYRRNLAKGQTGLSVAFDLPTQTGYDPDDELARGEVGKVGVPVSHIGDMRALFAGIPLAQMNTSMTINAPAMWLLALYEAVAREQADEAGADADDVVRGLGGTTQNDIIKEYLSRGTHVFPPGPSLRLTGDTIAYTLVNMPKWNPVNICSYHLQEAGATPVQEVAFAMATATEILDQVQARGLVPPERFGEVVARISFFVNAGVRFVEEMCKMRAFVQLWDELTRERYGVTDPKHRRFRYGVQVNSLGLTEAQPENNIQRIVLEMLGVTLSKDARARAVQLPAWNEALGLPRPWDQQWSLRMQQVLAYESDLLEYDDLFTGSVVVEAKVEQIVTEAKKLMARIEEMGGAVAAVESGFLKGELVASHARRRRRIEGGDEIVVGVNAFTTTEPSPLTENLDTAIHRVDPGVEAAAREAVAAWRTERDADPARAQEAAEALTQLSRDAADASVNLMPATVRCARAGVTTGEWAQALREVFGEFRAPTGVSGAVSSADGAEDSASAQRTRAVQQAVRETGEALGGPLRLLVGKPGLDGHSNGAEQVAVRARDVGFEVVYQGIRLRPSEIVAAAVAEDVHCVGISVLSGSHNELVPEILDGLRDAGAGDVPVVVGGIIPAADEARLLQLGVAAVFTPKDHDLTACMGRIVDAIRAANGLSVDRVLESA